LIRPGQTIALLGVLFGVLLAVPVAAEADFGFLPGSLSTTVEDSEGTPIVPQASSHPYDWTLSFKLNANSEGHSEGGEMRNLLIDLPQGMSGNPFAVPRCTRQKFEGNAPECSPETQVGIVHARTAETGSVAGPIYNLVPPPGMAAQLGFSGAGFNALQNLSVLNEAGYRVRVAVSLPLEVTSVTATIWGVPANAAHDNQRGRAAAVGNGSPVSSAAPELPFLTMPAECSEPLVTTVSIDSKLDPGNFVSANVESLDAGSNAVAPLGCASVPFSPQVSAAPTSHAASASSGLDFELKLPNEGLTNPGGIAETEPRKIEVALPPGVAANASLAEGIGVCSEAQYRSEQVDTAPGEGCPESSKLGSLVAHSPLLDEPIEGALYLAKPYENPQGTLIGLYLVGRARERGVLIKQSGKVVPDPQTGQLVTTLEGLPPLPYSDVDLHFREGARGPLVTPPTCGTYTTTAKLYPFSTPNTPVEKTASFQIERGPNGGPCPSGGTPPFNPSFEAGAENNAAGSYSPFIMRLSRQDGEQEMTRFSATLPPGVTGKIAGLTQCPQAAVEAAKAKTGEQELASPSCPASSLMGHTYSGAGVGAVLTYVPGSIYLGGPYHGDPLSVVAITPAVAGPFDVGTVVVQEALTVNPLTAEVEVDGAASDPIPHILAGIPLNLRDLQIHVDAPQVTLNATSCEEEHARASLWGGGADPFSAADDMPAALTQRYQAADCAALGFKPRLSLKLGGSRKEMKRSGNPALTAVLRPRPGQANIGATTVVLPHSQFIDQFHLHNPCTRVQYAEDGGNGAGCPAGSVLGTVTAWTPLLDEPLEGKIYFRTNGGERDLPDVVLSLDGLFHIEQIGFVDSVHERIRTRFASVPDAPIEKVVINFFGGKKGLLENSAPLCAHKQIAHVFLGGHNGRSTEGDQVIQTSCGKTADRQAGRHQRR
jgi:hypothetical protein